MKNRAINIVGVIIVLLIILGGLYWYYQNKIEPGFELLPGIKDKFTDSLEPKDSNQDQTPPSKTPEQVVADQIRNAFAKKYKITPDQVSLTIEQLSNSHAAGKVSLDNIKTDAWWLGFNDKGGWLLAAEGDKTVFCEEVDPYLFPSSFVPECYSQKLNRLLKR